MPTGMGPLSDPRACDGVCEAGRISQTRSATRRSARPPHRMRRRRGKSLKRRFPVVAYSRLDPANSFNRSSVKGRFMVYRFGQTFRGVRAGERGTRFGRPTPAGICRCGGFCSKFGLEKFVGIVAACADRARMPCKAAAIRTPAGIPEYSVAGSNDTVANCREIVID